MESHNTPAVDDQERWGREQAFFDGETYDEGPIPASTIQRYTTCRKPWLAPEYPFHLLGDVRGKYILEVGCGSGGNSLLLAMKGARVVGVDISRKAIEIARRRAELHGLSAQAAFFAGPLELFVPPDDRPFDVICGWAVLHHILPVLDQMMAEMVARGVPGAEMMFIEPIALWGWLRRLRLRLPINVGGTPDERPLEPGDLAIISRHADLRVRYHNALLRMWDRFFSTGRYEDMPRAVRMIYDCLGCLDDFLLNTVGLHGLASVATFHGRAKP